MMKTILTSLFLVVSFLVASERVAAKSTITGKLLKSTGKPLAYTEIELIPIDSDKIVSDPRYVAISDTSGQFVFSDVPSGVFDLSINSDDKPSELSPYGAFFFPNATDRKDARVFEIEDNTKISGLVFQLPPQLNKKSVTGKLIWKKGKLNGLAFVLLRDTKADRGFISFSQIKVDANGIFSMTAFEGRKYQLYAMIMDSYGLIGVPIANAKTEEFIVGKDPKIFELVLEDIKDSNRPLENDIGKTFKYFTRKVFEFS
jgi:hypothetical protein